MPRFGLCGPSYQSQSPNADAQHLINLYLEQVESQSGNAPLVLYSTHGSKTFVDLTRQVQAPVNGPFAIDGAGASGGGNSNTPSTAGAAPTAAGDWALYVVGSIGSASGYGGAWTAIDGNIAQQVTSAPVAGASTLGAPEPWAAALCLFSNIGGANPTQRQLKQQVSGATNIPNSVTFPNPVKKGDLIVSINQVGNNLGLASGLNSATDSQGNQYVVGQYRVAGQAEASIVFTFCREDSATLTVDLPAPAGLITGWVWTVYNFEGGAQAVTQSGPVRGELQINGRTFVVSGEDFDEIFANGTFTNWGTVQNDSLPVTMAASPQQLLLATAGSAYVFDLVANSLTQIPAATFSGPVSQAGICDGFFLLTIQSSKEFFVSAPLDATDWVTNGSAIVSVMADNLVSMLVHDRQIWFWTDRERTIYYDSGNIFPFDVIPETTIQAGSAALNAIGRLDDKTFWLNSDENGNCTVKMGVGYTPQRISNHAIEFALRSYAKVSDCVMYTMQDQGHNFVKLYFPTPSVTWVYDLTTGFWHQQAFFIEATGQYRAHLSQCHVFAFGMHLVGDWSSAKVYQLQIPTQTGSTWTFADDNGTPIRRVRRCPHISKEQALTVINELRVYAETGLGPQPPLLDGADNPRDPIMTLRWSKDGGHTWSNSYDRPCGQSGNYKTRARWLRLGTARDWIFEISMTDPIGWRLIDGYINPPSDMS